MRLHDRRDAKCLDQCRLLAGARPVLASIIITFSDLGLPGATEDGRKSERDVVEQWEGSGIWRNTDWAPT